MQQGVEQDRMIEGVSADERRRQIARHDPERGEPALHRRGLADTEEAVLAADPDPGAALARRVLGPPRDLKDFDVPDLHGHFHSFVTGLGPVIHALPEAIVKILPIRILSVDQPYLPGARPMLHILFALSCGAHVVLPFSIHEPL